jgi:cobyrinic acid a,c-diamide synthase
LEIAEVEATRDVTSAGDVVRVGVPSDHAFSFYYEDNLDLLREHGAEIVWFSPMTDASLPSNLDALYLGGGYPELHAEQLSGNRQMLEEVRTFAASGRPVYAECGGMLYLSESLSVDGNSYAMAGVLPLSMQMTDRLVHFGYVTVEFTGDCLLGRRGTVVRGHSFHHSRIASQGDVETSYHLQYSMSGKDELEGFRQGNVLASYIHLHFRANPAVAGNFVAAIRRARTLQAVTA